MNLFSSVLGAITGARRYHPDKHDLMDVEIAEMLSNGIIRPAAQPTWGSPAQLVPKADGGDRLVVDYTAVNKRTKPIRFNPYGANDILHNLAASSIFSTIDLDSGYWQIPVAEEHKSKTAVTCRSGIYEFNVMPFGLRNAPAVFQNLMTKVLRDLSWKCAMAYMDDVIIISKSLEEHQQHIDVVLQRLREVNLSIKLSKCQWLKPEVHFLGFLATAQGIKAIPENVAAIQVLPPPKDVQELQSFLGMTGHYQRFISKYAIKTEPLRRLKTKDHPFDWTSEQQVAFETLKNDIAELPTLRQPEFARPFELHSDAASTKRIAVILCQRATPSEPAYPLYFSSRSLTPAEKKYSIQELEALAIFWGVKKFRPFLEFGHFVVYTDHSSLKWFMDSKEERQGRLARWKLVLQSYSFDVIHVQGKLNDMLQTPCPVTLFQP